MDKQAAMLSPCITFSSVSWRRRCNVNRLSESWRDVIAWRFDLCQSSGG